MGRGLLWGVSSPGFGAKELAQSISVKKTPEFLVLPVPCASWAQHLWWWCLPCVLDEVMVHTASPVCGSAFSRQHAAWLHQGCVNRRWSLMFF